MKIYISGPITGTRGYMEKFKRAEDLLEHKGMTAINPAEINAGLPDDSTHDEYMAVSMTLLSLCSGIYMLSGWRESKGALEEFNYAVDKGYAIWFEEGKGDFLQ